MGTKARSTARAIARAKRQASVKNALAYGAIEVSRDLNRLHTARGFVSCHQPETHESLNASIARNEYNTLRDANRVIMISPRDLTG